METTEIPNRQLWLWLLGAQSALLTVGAGSNGWLTVLLTGLIGTILTIGVFRIGKLRVCKAFWILEWIWAVVMAGRILSLTGDCWQTERGETFLIPLTLLVLAVSAAWAETAQAARVGNILSWLMALIYLVILASGISGIHPERITTDVEIPAEILVLGYLLPCVAVLLPGERQQGRVYYIVPVLFALFISIITAGTLGAQYADDGFYEAVRGMSLLGTAERFESFLSVAMTMGWYSCLSLLTTVMGEAAGHIGKRGAGVAAGAVGAVLLFAVNISYPKWCLACGCLIAWCIVPALMQKRKSKNHEKGG